MNCAHSAGICDKFDNALKYIFANPHELVVIAVQDSALDLYVEASIAESHEVHSQTLSRVWLGYGRLCTEATTFHRSHSGMARLHPLLPKS